MRIAHRTTLILISVIATILFSFGLSLAQTELQLERLQVDLWPEFDRSDMLVIYRGTLAAGSPLPAALTLRLPARIGDPHAVAYDDGSGNLLEAQFSTTVADDWLVVSLEIPTPDFQVEFYDSLVRSGVKRSYTFVWPGDYAVEEFSLFLLPPPGATGVKTDPILSPVEQGSGAPAYAGTIGKLAQGQETHFVVDYSGGAVAASNEAQPSGNEGNANIVPIAAIGVAVLALVISGSVWYTRRSRRQLADAPAYPQHLERGKRRSSKKRAARDKPPSAGFCTQCGRALRTDDRFCGRCGSPVKENAPAQE